jgi:hypothetical protein
LETEPLEARSTVSTNAGSSHPVFERGGHGRRLVVEFALVCPITPVDLDILALARRDRTRSGDSIARHRQTMSALGQYASCSGVGQ